MNNKSDAVFTCLGAIVFVVATVVFATLLNGWILSVLWGWFVVPVFDLPRLSLTVAIGLGLISTLLVSEYIDTKDKDQAQLIGEALGKAVGRPLLVLFLGWIVHLFM